MAALQRKLLEQLREQDKLGLRDNRICRAYCVDFCIYDLFENTKVMNLKACQFIHSDKHRDEYRRGPKIPLFEAAFDEQLRLLLNTRAKRIHDGLQRIRPSGDTLTPHLVELAEEVHENAKLADLLAAEIKMLVGQGKTELALSEAKALETLRTKAAQVAKKFNAVYENAGPNAHQHLQPCYTCGLFIASNDTDERLAAHFEGKMHLGFVRALEVIESRGVAI